MRPRYRRVRDTLVEALARQLPDLQPMGVSAGLHLMTWFPPDRSELAVIQAAERRGVQVYGIRPYWLGDPGPAGLVFGYGGLTESTIAHGIDLLADAMHAL